MKCRLIPESTLSSQNIAPFKHLYVTLPDCTPPSQNIHPPFKHLRSISDPPRIYPSLPKYTRLLYKATLLESTYRAYPFFHNYVQHSHDLPLPPRIYTPPLLNIFDLYATLPESALPSQNIPAFYIKRHS